MPKIDNIKRIIVEDFDKDQQDTIAKIAEVLNPFMEQVYNALNNRIDFTNLNQEVITLTTTVNSSGVPTKALKFATSVVRYSYGAIVVSVENTTDRTMFPSAAVFVSFVPENSGLFSVQRIFGLLPNKEYKITTVIIGK